LGFTAPATGALLIRKTGFPLAIELIPHGFRVSLHLYGALLTRKTGFPLAIELIPHGFWVAFEKYFISNYYAILNKKNNQVIFKIFKKNFKTDK